MLVVALGPATAVPANAATRATTAITIAGDGPARYFGAMSEHNVDVARGAVDAFNRGDIEAVLSLFDPDIVLTQTPEVETLGIPRQQRGHEGLLEAFATWPEQWDDFRIEIQRVVADPGDHVVVATRQRGRGKQSGVEVEAEFTYVFTVHEKITELRVFERQDEALEAVGLSE